MGPQGPPGPPGGPPGPPGPPGPASPFATNECEDNNGNCSQICVDTYDGYCCMCKAGYKLEPLMIPGCTVDNIVCRETLDAGYQCICNIGTKMIPVNGTDCINFDECSVANGGCHQKCTDTDGSYYCSCVPGFRLGPDMHTCVDVDECENATLSKVCPSGATCINSYGSYRCFQENAIASVSGAQSGNPDPTETSVSSTLQQKGIGLQTDVLTIWIAIITGAVILNFLSNFAICLKQRRSETTGKSAEYAFDDIPASSTTTMGGSTSRMVANY
ncbi:fibrillin-1 [Lingula anatina]|uniref:Fibrillin-1 n=1 Tax=Lingula anatina TaxID=7574 RepID=A0A1S3K2G6_LINAN|nr:fibrillin-1 [Lingula anatina]|eukprot:XP_013416830.1 fibrillin-1 [Lingula anatina]